MKWQLAFLLLVVWIQYATAMPRPEQIVPETAEPVSENTVTSHPYTQQPVDTGTQDAALSNIEKAQKIASDTWKSVKTVATNIGKHIWNIAEKTYAAIKAAAYKFVNGDPPEPPPHDPKYNEASEPPPHGTTNGEDSAYSSGDETSHLSKLKTQSTGTTIKNAGPNSNSDANSIYSDATDDDSPVALPVLNERPSENDPNAKYYEIDAQAVNYPPKHTMSLIKIYSKNGLDPTYATGGTLRNPLSDGVGNYLSILPRETLVEIQSSIIKLKYLVEADETAFSSFMSFDTENIQRSHVYCARHKTDDRSRQ